jgi:hypothetical protein
MKPNYTQGMPKKKGRGGKARKDRSPGPSLKQLKEMVCQWRLPLGEGQVKCKPTTLTPISTQAAAVHTAYNQTPV